MYRALIFFFVFTSLGVASFQAMARIYFEDDDGREWECDDVYCYSDETRQERNDFDRWLKETDNTKVKYTKDPLNMNKHKDPLAMPKSKKANNNDPLAF